MLGECVVDAWGEAGGGVAAHVVTSLGEARLVIAVGSACLFALADLGVAVALSAEGVEILGYYVTLFAKLPASHSVSVAVLPYDLILIEYR
jgi:hypothetical protein